MLDQVVQSADAGFIPEAPSMGNLLPASISNSASTAVAKVPAIFRRRMQEKLPAEVQAKAAEVQAKAIGVQDQVIAFEKRLLDICKAFMPQTVLNSNAWRHLFDPQLAHQVAKCMPNADLDCWATSGVSICFPPTLTSTERPHRAVSSYVVVEGFTA